jgi:organic hydroperoxide reductase OsmC/OhrA
MSEHLATIDWARGDAPFEYASYTRDHTWAFDGGATCRASAAPAFKGNPELVDPEEALVAALSSCHMLTFLALAAKHKHVVESYHDEAVGAMAKDDGGGMSIQRVTLRPAIVFAPGTAPEADALAALHDKAHEMCFIARSVKCDVVVESTVGAGS